MENSQNMCYICASQEQDDAQMYNPVKAAQVIAYLAIRSGQRALDVLKAVKLVYLADRENMRRFGVPILDEKRASLKLGPVNSATYDHIKGEVDLEGSGWSEILDARANHMVGVKGGVDIDDLDELSDAEIETLDSVWQTFGKMDRWQLVHWTHDPRHVPEWEDPGSSSSQIPLERMLRAVGISDPDHAAFLEDQARIGQRLAALA